MKQHVKTLLATLCLLILCGAQRAEAQQHLTFQGISFDNSFQAFGKALVAQGYEMDEEDNDFFYGKFLGEEATLLLAVDSVIKQAEDPRIAYFPSYEIVNDELRDYRFYQEDMLHPSMQAVSYIFERLADAYFSPATQQFLQRWKPIREAFAHRPFHPESEAYQMFLVKTRQQYEALKKDYPMMEE